MTARVKNLVLAALALLPGACTLPPRANPPPETQVVIRPAPPSEVDQLLSYAAKLRKYDARDAALDRESLKAIATRERTDFVRIKYAMVLSVSPAQGAQDDAEIIAVLEPLVVNAPAADVELRSLALLLHGAASERRRLRDQVRELQAKAGQVRRDDTRETENRALRVRIDELEAKLFALKSIDRSVNRRTEPK